MSDYSGVRSKLAQFRSYGPDLNAEAAKAAARDRWDRIRPELAMAVEEANAELLHEGVRFDVQWLDPFNRAQVTVSVDGVKAGIPTLQVYSMHDRSIAEFNLAPGVTDPKGTVSDEQSLHPWLARLADIVITQKIDERK